MYVYNLPRVVTWQCTRQKSNQQLHDDQLGKLPLHH